MLMGCWLVSSHRSLVDSDRLRINWLRLVNSDGFLVDSDWFLVNSGRFTVAIGAFKRSCISMSFTSWNDCEFTISVIINVRLRDFKVDCEPWVLSDDIDEVLVSSEIVNNINSLNEVGHIHNDRWSLWFTIFIKVDSDGAVGL